MCLAPSMSSTREARETKCGKGKCRQIGCASCPQEFSGIKMNNLGLKCIFGRPEFWSQFQLIAYRLHNLRPSYHTGLFLQDPTHSHHL